MYTVNFNLLSKFKITKQNYYKFFQLHIYLSDNINTEEEIQKKNKENYIIELFLKHVVVYH